MFPILVFLLLSLSLTKGQYEPMAQPGSGVDLNGRLRRGLRQPEAKFVFKKKRMTPHNDTGETIGPFQSWSINDAKPSVKEVSSSIAPNSKVVNPPHYRNLKEKQSKSKVNLKPNFTVSNTSESLKIGLDSNLNLTVAVIPEPIVLENADYRRGLNIKLTENIPVFKHQKPKFREFSPVNLISVVSHKKKNNIVAGTDKQVKKLDSVLDLNLNIKENKPIEEIENVSIKNSKSGLISNLDLLPNNAYDLENATSKKVGNEKSEIKESGSLHKGSRKFDSKSEDFGSSLEADVLQNLLSNEDSYQLYQYTDQLIKRLLAEYMSLAMVAADNSNASKFTYSVTQYFVLQFCIMSSQNPSNADNYYDTVFDLALNKTKERRGNTAIQFAAPVRRAADIFVALIDTPINIVQTNCDQSEANCVVKFAEILSTKEVKYCKNALYHAVVFLKVLDNIKDADETEVLNKVFRENLNEIKRRDNSDISKPQKSVLVNPNIQKYNSDVSKPNVGNTDVPEKNVKAPKYVTIDSKPPKGKEPPKSVLENPETADTNARQRRRSMKIPSSYFRKRNTLVLESPNSALFDPRVPRDIEDQNRPELVESKIVKDKEVEERKSEALVELARSAVNGAKSGEADAKSKNDENFDEIFDQVIRTLNKKRDLIRNYLEDSVAVFQLIQQYQDEEKLTCLSIKREQ